MSPADRAQRQQREDERRYEAAQRGLGTEVPGEVAQRSRAELLRRERERDDRHREHDTEHGDDPGGERAQQLPRSVRALNPHPRRQRGGTYPVEWTQGL